MTRSPILALGAAAALSACGEAAIDMRLEPPPPDMATRFVVSCIGAVEVFVRGNDRGRSEDYEETPADDTYACIEVGGVGSYADLRGAIAGRFQLDLPGSGLAGVDVRGSTGSCKKDNAPGDTLFYASAEYDGGDELVIPMTPHLSCNAMRPETVRPVDLLALTKTGVCPGPLPDNSGGVDSTTIHPSALDDAYLDFNNDFASLAGGVATLPLYVVTDDASCVALSYWDNPDVMTTASCVRRMPGVCSQPNQIELPIIGYAEAYGAANVETVDEYGGLVIGGVWGDNGAAGKVKLAGATVRPAKAADAARAKVVYADYPAGAANPRELAGATATNATGLFIAYVGRPIDFIVSAPGYRDETVRMGSPDEPSTALILLSRL